MHSLFSALDAKELALLFIGIPIANTLFGKLADLATGGLGRIKPEIGAVINAIYSKVEDGRLTSEEAKDLVKAAIERYLA